MLPCKVPCASFSRIKHWIHSIVRLAKYLDDWPITDLSKAGEVDDTGGCFGGVELAGPVAADEPAAVSSGNLVGEGRAGGVN